MPNRPGRVGKSFQLPPSTAELLAATAARLQMDQTRVLVALIDEYAPSLQVHFRANSSPIMDVQVTKKVKKRA